MSSGMDLLLHAAECSDGCSTSTGSASASSNTHSNTNSNMNHHVLYSNFLSASKKRPNNINNNNVLTRTCSNSSLPPKKRIRLSGMMMNESFQWKSDTSLSTLGMSVATSSSGDCGRVPLLGAAHRHGSDYTLASHVSSSSCTESPSVNSEWTSAELLLTRPSQGQVKNSKECNLLELIVSKRDSNKKKKTKKTSKKKGVSNSSLKRSSTSRKRLVSDASAISSDNTSAAANKKKKSLLMRGVKDLDGNDMCMGYFSMKCTTKSSSSSIKEEIIKPAADTKPQDSSEEEQPSSVRAGEAAVMLSSPCSAKSIVEEVATTAAVGSNQPLLYEAYLQALTRPT